MSNLAEVSTIAGRKISTSDTDSRPFGKPFSCRCAESRASATEKSTSTETWARFSILYARRTHGCFRFFELLQIINTTHHLVLPFVPIAYATPREFRLGSIRFEDWMAMASQLRPVQVLDAGLSGALGTSGSGSALRFCPISAMNFRSAAISSASQSSITSLRAASRLSTCSFDIPDGLFTASISRRYAEMR